MARPALFLRGTSLDAPDQHQAPRREWEARGSPRAASRRHRNPLRGLAVRWPRESLGLAVTCWNAIVSWTVSTTFRKLAIATACVAVAAVACLAIGIVLGIAGYGGPAPRTEVTQQKPYADYIGREYRVVGDVSAYAWNDFPDKDKDPVSHSHAASGNAQPLCLCRDSDGKRPAHSHPECLAVLYDARNRQVLRRVGS